ncbi:MAG: aspartate kinase [Candidatus Micrarchaeota archaeon]|nr:aspartate kinase [Candidatus Micrarchaeota archaeon]
MIVMKFGGSSVRDAEMIKKVTEIVRSSLDRKPIVVVSACQGITDLLLKAIDESFQNKLDAYLEIEKRHRKIINDLKLKENLIEDLLSELKNLLTANYFIKEKGNRLRDHIAFFGERMSSTIIAEYMKTTGLNAKQFDSGDLGLITDDNFGNASIMHNTYELIRKAFKEKVNNQTIPIITGFGGKTLNNEYTTFDRGGSDYVASIFGAALNAEEIQIWTDVSGIYSCDPRIVPNAKKIELMAFEEASELAYFGAKVLHPKTILPAIESKIPVKVLNTFDPEDKGTTIVDKCEHNETTKILALSIKNAIVIEVKSTRMLDTYGYLEKAFAIFSKYKKSVDMITTSEITITLTVDSDKFVKQISEDLKQIANVKTYGNQKIVYVLCNPKFDKNEIVSSIFRISQEIKVNIHMLSMCYDTISIGLVVDDKDSVKLVKELHKKLIET